MTLEELQKLQLQIQSDKRLEYKLKIQLQSAIQARINDELLTIYIEWNNK